MAAAMRLFAVLAQDGRLGLYVLHHDGEVEFECGHDVIELRELRAEVKRLRAELAERELPPAPPREEPVVVAEAPAVEAPRPRIGLPSGPAVRALMGEPEPPPPPPPPPPPAEGFVPVRWKDARLEDVPVARAARYVAAGHVELVNPERDGPAVLAAHDALQDEAAKRLQGDGLLHPGGASPAPDLGLFGRMRAAGRGL
jgi:hypothetical protein